MIENFVIAIDLKCANILKNNNNFKFQIKLINEKNIFCFPEHPACVIIPQQVMKHHSVCID